MGGIALNQIFTLCRASCNVHPRVLGCSLPACSSSKAPCVKPFVNILSPDGTHYVGIPDCGAAHGSGTSVGNFCGLSAISLSIAPNSSPVSHFSDPICGAAHGSDIWADMYCVRPLCGPVVRHHTTRFMRVRPSGITLVCPRHR